jgi:perosamine synthetase
MTDLEAAIGIKQMEKLDLFLSRRRENAKYLDRVLEDIDLLQLPYSGNHVKHSYNQYSILLNLELMKGDRGRFIEALRAENIDARVYYPVPLHKQPILVRLLSNISECPVSDDISNRIISLPVHPQLEEEDLEVIGEAVRKVSNHFCLR